MQVGFVVCYFVVIFASNLQFILLNIYISRIYFAQLLGFLVQICFDFGKVEILARGPTEYIEYIIAGGPKVRSCVK